MHRKAEPTWSAREENRKRHGYAFCLSRAFIFFRAELAGGTRHQYAPKVYTFLCIKKNKHGLNVFSASIRVYPAGFTNHQWRMNLPTDGSFTLL